MALERLTSADDPRLDPYRALPGRDREQHDDLFVVEARSVVRHLLASRRHRTHSILMTETALPALADALAARADVPVYVVPAAVVRAVVGFDFHRGCLALGERSPEPTVDELLAAGPRRLVLLEHVANPDNVGAIFRNAMAFGTDAVLLTRQCCDPLYRKSIRVSAGGALRIPFAHTTDWPTTLARVRESGLTLIALAPRGGIDVSRYDTSQLERAALVLGTEGDGLSQKTLDAADAIVTIPMAHGVDSLNVATACAIALHRLG